jgi:hypothetical protein
LVIRQSVWRCFYVRRWRWRRTLLPVAALDASM